MRTKVILALIMGLTLTAALCGCGASEETKAPVDMAIVSGYHANAPTPALQSKTVSEAINLSTASYGSVSVIVSDGAPFVAASYNISAPDRELSAAKKAEIAKAQSVQIGSVLSWAQAETPEVDTLAAIALAARSLSHADGVRRILVMDTGLSTCGYIDFTQNLLRAQSDAVVSYLEDMKALPNLSGVEVVWVGLGDVGGEQAALTPSNKETLRTIWYDTLSAAGAASVIFEDDLPGMAVEDSSSLPNVTPVAIIPDDPFSVGEDTFTGPYILDEGKILFRPDSAEFADRSAAVDALTPIADYLIGHPNEQIVLVGTTATAGTRESCAALSTARAKAVKSLLLELGAAKAQFNAIYGMGFDNPFHVNDLNADGSLNASTPANRSVVVLGMASEYLVKIADYL